MVTTADIKQEDIKQEEQRLLRLSYVPMATSCALYEGRLILDPDAEEEVLAASTVTSVVDERGRLIGTPRPMHKAYELRFTSLQNSVCQMQERGVLIGISLPMCSEEPLSISALSAFTVDHIRKGASFEARVVRL